MLKTVLLILCVTPIFCHLKTKDFGKNLQNISNYAHKSCELYSGISEQQIQNIKDGNFDGPEVSKRYVACLWILSDIVDLDLNVNKNAIKALEPKLLKGEAVQRYSNCIEVGKKSDVKEYYDRIWIALKCVHDDDPQHFIQA